MWRNQKKKKRISKAQNHQLTVEERSYNNQLPSSTASSMPSTPPPPTHTTNRDMCKNRKNFTRCQSCLEYELKIFQVVIQVIHQSWGRISQRNFFLHFLALLFQYESEYYNGVARDVMLYSKSTLLSFLLQKYLVKFKRGSQKIREWLSTRQICNDFR